MNRRQFIISSSATAARVALALAVATAALVASASARERGGELRREYAEAAFGREGEQAPAPPPPIMTEKSSGTGPLDRLSFRAIGPATPSGRVAHATTLPTNTQQMQIRDVKAAMPGLIGQANATVEKLAAVVKEMMGSGALFPVIKPISK